MRQASSRATAVTERAGLYQEITDRIISELEAGRLPWVQPWSSASAAVSMPKNAATGRAYSGINVLILWNAVVTGDHESQNWLTFRQALDAGGNVRKGEHGTTVVYADRFTPEKERARAAKAGETPGSIPFLKRFTVFNVDQCDSLPEKLVAPPPPPRMDLVLPRAQALIDATGSDFRIGGGHAYYSPSGDYVQVPAPQDYHEPINWHRTAFHELGHWSGHPTRLNRDLTNHFGTTGYAREELVAEMAGAFLCASLGITPTVRHADYIGSWLDVLRADNRAIVRAASAASKAAELVLGFEMAALTAE